jgi:hypothetical protein
LSVVIKNWIPSDTRLTSVGSRGVRHIEPSELAQNRIDDTRHSLTNRGAEARAGIEAAAPPINRESDATSPIRSTAIVLPMRFVLEQVTLRVKDTG